MGDCGCYFVPSRSWVQAESSGGKDIE